MTEHHQLVFGMHATAAQWNNKKTFSMGNSSSFKYEISHYAIHDKV